MTRKLVIISIGLIVVALGAAACSPPTVAPTLSPGNASTPAPAIDADSDLARTDSQGAVEFVVTPLNLSSPGSTLEFKVVMDTHSVDLAWDLAAQATLATETGLQVPGLSWLVGSGHHYENTLTFPAQTAEGKALLDGATTLTLTIRNTDVAERQFVWEIPK